MGEVICCSEDATTREGIGKWKLGNGEREMSCFSFAHFAPLRDMAVLGNGK